MNEQVPRYAYEHISRMLTAEYRLVNELRLALSRERAQRKLAESKLGCAIEWLDEVLPPVCSDIGAEIESMRRIKESTTLEPEEDT